MAITHKGISMLLKHHALDPEKNSDDDVKNCVDAAIKNSDDALPEESESGASEEAEEPESVTNRADREALEAAEAKVAELEAEKAALEKKLKEKPAPLYNRRTAGQPNVEIEGEDESAAEAASRQEKISNRASELEKTGVNPIVAYNRAYAEFSVKNRK